MKFNFLFVCYVCFFFFVSAPVSAQSLEAHIQSYWKSGKQIQSLLPQDIASWQITDQYEDPATGLTYLYTQQYYQNIPVYNAISIFVFKGHDLLYAKPGVIAGLATKVNTTAAVVEPEEALLYAFDHFAYSLSESPVLVYADPAKQIYRFEVDAICSSPVLVKLLYVQTDSTLRLAWDVSFEVKNEPHWWNIRIDAQQGTYLNHNDYTVHCDVDCAMLGHSTTEAQSPDPAPPTAAIPGYRVFPFPVEAPSFGSRSLLIDPSSAQASPFGWHDVDGLSGEEFTILRGNNVYAYEDMNNDNLPGYSADGGTTLNFDFPFTAGATAITNADASLTNLFYANNAIHDYLYPLGFAEVHGNFQVNNYGNGGAQNDGVKAECMDGGGTNNANFATPPDGSAGRMQMYLWTGSTVPCTNLQISSGFYTGSMAVGVATFSPQASVTANVILVNDGIAPLTDGCSPPVNSLAGKIALIDRGGSCTFSGKVQIAQNAGAVGVIIANDVTGTPPVMTGSGPITIPAVSISYSDGLILKSALLTGAVNATVNTCTVNPVDASFDNGIIIHEYAHGVSNRLTGGPSQSGCLVNAEQGGEGWSDWFALMLTIEPGDQGTNARGIATYARSQPTTGAGIRRLPYSTNMAINNQTYASLASSSTVHQRGEIWCTVLWDMSWKLIDAYGFSNNPSLASAGNNIALRLVMEGMKLQPCNPGYLDARDAILMADALLYANAHRCLIWEAFAGRGMGFSALQGSVNIVGDETAAFNMPPFCLPPTQAPVASFVVDSLTITCGKTVHFTDQSTQAFSWLWDFGDQSTSILTNPSHTYTSPGTYTVKLIVTNPLGVDSMLQTIIVTHAFTVTIGSTPDSICAGSAINLTAIAGGSNNRSYAVQAIPFAPVAVSGTVVSLADDQMSNALPIGFTFNFFGQDYTSFYICSNGFITFSASMPASPVYGMPIPGLSLPHNFIALAWNDLNPTITGSSIQYATTGVAPNRRLIVTYSAPHYLSATLPFQVQAILYEGSHDIEIHTTIISDASGFDPGATTTQGVENADGTQGVAVPGRNSALFAASNDAFRFTPITPYSYTWQPGSLNGASQVVNPLSTTTYSVQVSDGSACELELEAPPVYVSTCQVQMDLHLLIEGYYIGNGQMQSVVSNAGVSSNVNLCDSITVELRSSVSPFQLVASTKTIMDISGFAECLFTVPYGDYYLAVEHQNALQTWSAQPLHLDASVMIYDFTIAASKAFGNNLVEVESGKWALFSGDLNRDESIDLIDAGLLEASVNSFQFGYLNTDINGDGNVDLLDSMPLESNIVQFIFSAHP